MRIDRQQRLLRNELRQLLPGNKDDVEAIQAIAARGYPATEPILLDLFKWIRIESWPVARPACEFLVSIGSRLEPQVQHVLGGHDDVLKAVVLRRIVSEWSSDDVGRLSSRLFMIATDGQSWRADLLALGLLAQHGIGDPEWIAGWLEFKREHHEKRLADIGGILGMLKDKGIA